MIKQLAKWIILVYRGLISPLTGAKCRFFPTCSAYALEALDKHGVTKGLFLTGKRLCKCHPYYKGDFFDPVP